MLRIGKSLCLDKEKESEIEMQIKILVKRQAQMK